MKPFELSIPKPCHENWERMTPEDKGRFCGACQKTVIDFSGMSDAQLAQFFKKPTGQVCGRFDASQINRVVNVPRKQLPWIRYFFAVALPAILFSRKAAAQGEVRLAKPQGQKENTSDCTAKKAVPNQIQSVTDTARLEDVVVGFVSTKMKKAPQVVKGRIVNEKGEAVPFATVAAREEGRVVVADSLGNFSLKCFTLPETLEVSSVGYGSQTVFHKGEEKFTVNLRLAEPSIVYLGFVVTTKAKKKPSGKSVEQKEITKPREGKLAVPFAIYPNPVSANASFTLDAKSLESGTYDLQVLSVSGDVVLTRALAIEKKARQSVSIGDLAAGTYVVRLISKAENRSHSQILLVR